jgi:selenocysteine-specific elongation factor
LDAFLQILAESDPPSILLARIARRNHGGITLTELIAETGWPGKMVEAHLADPVHRGQVLRIGDRFVHAPALEGLKLLITGTVAAFHQENPLVQGVGKQELRERVQAPGEEAESKKIIEDAFALAGLKVPALKEVLAGLRVDTSRGQKIVTLLLRERALVKVSEDLVFHREALEDLRKRMASEKVKSSKIDIARFKDLTGVSRKYAIPLLEYLDREHVTRRVGDERIIL